ncbi:MAG: hypothetical protein HY810_05920 [Candidatus Omnitrophica bacterium]|nr:hypothetical protein [Candidatus Omnitrophota bacterium]
MNVDLSELKAIPQEKCDALANKKIYFGHQSVGYNIIEGVEDIMLEIPQLKLNIKETNSMDDFLKPVFAHSAVGVNSDPYSKINDFRKNIESGIGEKADAAFFKFCYVDIVDGADYKKIFEQYKRAILLLEEKYPKVKFLHSTVPLQAANPPIKVFIKKMMGKSDEGQLNNIQRNKFNEMMISEYGSKGNVFDLAGAESSYADGKREFFKDRSKKYYSMIPGFSNDGGHLNKFGRKTVAAKLIIYLSSKF